MKAFDPYWPFPQYDKQGRQLLPPPQPKRQVDTSGLEEALL